MQKDPQKALVDKATSDPEFRAKLVADPKEALNEAFGVTLPAGLTVTVLEETADQRYIVLPSTEVSEDELADVSGGTSIGWS